MPFRKTPATDAASLLALSAAWAAAALTGRLEAWPVAALAPAAVVATLLACKALSWPPPLRALAAVGIALVAATLAPGRGALIALGAALATAGAYLAFGALRRAWFALAYRLPDGRPDGFDHGRWLRWSERMRARGRRRWRVRFPRTDKEATLRAADWLPGDRIDFGDLDAAALGGHDLVLPLSARDLDAIEPLRERLAGHPIALPTRACIALCGDKPRFNRALQQLGFGAHVPAMDGPLPWPYILKRGVGEWGVDCHVVADADDERRHAARLADPAYFRQAYVPGATEYTTHVLVRGGRVLRSLTLEFTFAHDRPVKSRDCAAIAIRLRRGTHTRLFAAMLRAIGFEGLGCFNYKLVDGRPMVFEFNPRFGASLAPFFPWFLRSLR